MRDFKKIFPALLGTLLFLTPFLQAQSEVQISKPRLNLSDGYLVIEYDILNSTAEDLFTVWIDASTSSGTVIIPRSIFGHVGRDVEGGSNKRILWNLMQDSLYINDEIFVEVNAELQVKPGAVNVRPPEKEQVTLEEDQESRPVEPLLRSPAISKTTLVTSSILLPGLGQTRLNRGKPYWLYGVAGYACIAGSVSLNRSAYNAYEEYKNELSSQTRNDLYTQAYKQNVWSNVLAYTALGIWATDVIIMLATPQSKIDARFAGNQNRLYFTPAYDRRTNSPLFSFCLKF